ENAKTAVADNAPQANNFLSSGTVGKRSSNTEGKRPRRNTRGKRSSRFQGSQAAYAKVPNNRVVPGATRLAVRQKPDTIYDQTVGLAGCVTAAIGIQIELVKQAPPAKWPFRCASIAKPGTGLVVGFGEGIGDVKLVTLREAVTQFKLKRVIPALTDGGQHGIALEACGGRDRYKRNLERGA